ncbi:MAG: winged helix-turn-helix transcriptional regulator [Candidatus Doudnabacteria bacterium]|nr:winged helix-turn-helix transcriptional regulator [Candidatus Doudnabacteria bacterium]
MVEYALQLDFIFGSLAASTRRDILRRVAKKQLTVSEVAKPYKLTFAAISKHLKVLEKAKLIVKRRKGKEHIIQMQTTAINGASEYLKYYETIWNQRFDNLDKLLTRQQAGKKGQK